MVVASEVLMVHVWDIIALSRGGNSIYEFVLESGDTKVILPSEVVGYWGCNILDRDLVGITASPRHETKITIVL